MTIERRHFVRLLGAGAVVACPLCQAALAAEKSSGHGTSATRDAGRSVLAKAETGHQPAGQGGHAGWSYDGASGPEHWGDMSAEYQACGAGSQQSPIDLSSHFPSLFNDLSIHWRPTEFEMVNNGHTIQANADAGSYVMTGGMRYDLLQFHFHSPSEHTVDGRPYSMECHFVHKAATGSLTVLGVFMTPGTNHGELAKVWSGMPPKAGQKQRLRGPIDPRLMLPSNGAVYRYSGSLTTPPCSEVVNWVVFRSPIEVSGGQIAQFVKLYAANARPVQSLHRRFVLGNF